MPAEPFELTIKPTDLKEFIRVFNKIEKAGRDTTPLMRWVSTTLLSQTEKNFKEEGSPEWPDLAASTIVARKKDGHWPGKKEQITGGLAASTSFGFGPTFSFVGQSKIYAAIQNLGGEARGHSAKIPARPSLPILPDGSIQPDAKDAVMEDVLLYFKWVSS